VGPATFAEVIHPQRLTIDSTVAIDRRDDSQERHKWARALVALAKRGEVELAAASSGYLVDFSPENPVWQMLDHEGVSGTAQLAYPGVIYPGENAFPGAYVAGLRQAWDAILADWKTHEGGKPEDEDWLHVETHVMEKRDVFITDDDDLRVMCRRLREERGFEVQAMSLREYFDRRRRQPRVNSP
jgi:hypothetical protein